MEDCAREAEPERDNGLERRLLLGFDRGVVSGDDDLGIESAKCVPLGVAICAELLVKERGVFATIPRTLQKVFQTASSTHTQSS